ncbi:MAG TPA: tartrate dehydrogenase [Candidatus Nanopelagicaceae bacterium]|nr:tartrate dehydrogenase [Candidatus Nanopelagicaceae bacterium]
MKIAVIPGDGVGQEVIAAGIQVLSAVADLEYQEFPWGSRYFEKTGAMMPKDGLAKLQDCDAIYLGAVGWPSVPDHITLWGLLLPIRQAFQQYINLRPVNLLPGISSPLRARTPAEIDMLFIRENSEGEYSGAGGRVHRGTPQELAVKVPVFTRLGIERAARYALERAMERGPHLISVTKSNASRYVYVLWDEVVEGLAATEFPEVRVERMHVDAMAARMVLRPQSIDVVLGSNLFADILTDLGAAIQGSLGLAASANLDPSRTHPSVFEPVHGSAPDIAGKGLANPLGAILTGALLLSHLGLREEAQRVEHAVGRVTGQGVALTADLGGSARTADVVEAVLAELRRPDDGGGA